MIKIALAHCVGCIFLVVLGCNDLDIKGLDPNDGLDAGDVNNEEIPDEALDAGTGDEPPKPDLDDAGVTATRPDGGLPSEPLLGNAASDSFYQGSWRAPIKRSDTDVAGWQSCDLETGWDANDIEKMKAHFEATNQNLFIQHIQWPLASANECDWKNWREIKSNS